MRITRWIVITRAARRVRYNSSKMEAYVHDAVLDMQAARDELLATIAGLNLADSRRYVPYGGDTLHDLLSHLAAADHAWALAAQGLLKGEGQDRRPISPAEATAIRNRAIERGRTLTIQQLQDEMQRRRRLLLALYDLLEPRHLAVALRSYGERHNSVRERIWVGYHDRLHAADVRRALRLTWQPQHLKHLPELLSAVESLSPDATLYVVYSVAPVYWERASSVAGWTYRQLLMHIATGDWVLQMHLRRLVETGSVAEWPDIDAGNAGRLKERAHSTYQTLTEEFLSMREETLQLIAQLQPKHLLQPIELWWDPAPAQHTVLDYIVGFQAHDATHREQLRPAMKYATARAGGA